MKTTLVLICPMALLGCSLDVPALAPETTPSEESAQLGSPGSDPQHCVIQATAVPIGQDVTDAPPVVSPRCFSTFSQAINFATAGRVALPNDATPEALDESALADASATQYVLSIEFEHRNHGGSSHTFYGSKTCKDATYWEYSVPSSWNDRISSSRAYSDCNHTYHYEHPGYVGAMVDCGRGCSYIGDAMDDRTSSINWTN